MSKGVRKQRTPTKFQEIKKQVREEYKKARSKLTQAKRDLNSICTHKKRGKKPCATCK